MIFIIGSFLILVILSTSGSLLKKWKNIFILYHNIIHTHNLILKEILPIIVRKIDEENFSEEEKAIFKRM